jgi:hypothetical protein
MNIFRFLGDMSHVFSIIVLLLRLRVVKNAAGISLRTHELFLIVFCARYLDLFTTFYRWVECASFSRAIERIERMSESSEWAINTLSLSPAFVQNLFSLFIFFLFRSSFLPSFLPSLLLTGFSLAFNTSINLHLLLLSVCSLHSFHQTKSVYNSCMKILYISTTAYVVYMIRYTDPIASTYDKAQVRERRK